MKNSLRSNNGQQQMGVVTHGGALADLSYSMVFIRPQFYSFIDVLVCERYM